MTSLAPLRFSHVIALANIAKAAPTAIAASKHTLAKIIRICSVLKEVVENLAK